MESRQVKRAKMRKEATIPEDGKINGARSLRRWYKLNSFKPWFKAIAEGVGVVEQLLP